MELGEKSMGLMGSCWLDRWGGVVVVDEWDLCLKRFWEWEWDLCLKRFWKLECEM